MSDAVEQAIVNFVVRGALEAQRKTNQVDADLTSVERSGQRAENASKAADTAAQKAARTAEELTRRAEQALGRLAQVAGLASSATRVAQRAGAPEEVGVVAGAFGEAVGTGAQAFVLTPGGPFVKGGVAIGAGVLAGGSSLYEGFGRIEEQRAKEREQTAKAVADEIERRKDGEEIVKSAALDVMSQRLGGSRIR